MPNHVSTDLTVTGDKKELKEFREKHFRVEEQDGLTVDIFDFDTIIPMPKSLDIVSGSNTTNAMAVLKAKQGDFTEIDRIAQYSWVKDKKSASSTMGDREYTIQELERTLDEKAMEEGKMALENIEKYGCATWYDWKVSKWGTKWGAYDVSISQAADDVMEISYSTAWSPASPIFDKLNEMYPNLSFEQNILDEGMGFGGKQVWDSSGYYEEMYEGDDLMEFCNKYYGYDYTKCKCGEWYCMDWIDEDDDQNLCEECNMEKKEVKE